MARREAAAGHHLHESGRMSLRQPTQKRATRLNRPSRKRDVPKAKGFCARGFPLGEILSLHLSCVQTHLPVSDGQYGNTLGVGQQSNTALLHNHPCPPPTGGCPVPGRRVLRQQRATPLVDAAAVPTPGNTKGGRAFVVLKASAARCLIVLCTHVSPCTSERGASRPLLPSGLVPPCQVKNDGVTKK